METTFTHGKMFPMLNKPCLTLIDIESCLKNCNSIKYAAYRTAAKLRILQKAFHLGEVRLNVISSVFERHQLQQTENSVLLDQKEVEALLSDVYFALQKGNNVVLDVEHYSQLMFNFFSNVFDKKTSKIIQVFSLKVALTLLCESKPREKYHYLFEQLADHNNCLSRKKLEILLKKMIILIEHLGEGHSFGLDLIPGTVESCFQCNIGSLGLSEDVFMAWLTQDPQLLVWLSTMYRMQVSESVTHNTKCEICKVFPLSGLRYRCLRCLAYDMCQSCFFSGKLSKKHKLKHPVQEYCCPMTSHQSTKAFLLTLRNRLYKRDGKLQYLPALRVDSPHPSESMGDSTRLLDQMEISSRTVVNGSRISLEKFPYRELHNIVSQLERESEEIIPQIDNFCSALDGTKECREELKCCLLKHSAQVKAQVLRLKLLKKYLASNGKFSAKAFVASTPVFDEGTSKLQKRDLRVDLLNLSPITVRTSGKRAGGNCSGKSTFECPDVPQMPNGSKAAEKKEETDLELSSLMGGSALRTLQSSGSWLREGTSEEKTRKENEETLEELQLDLKRILTKLQELSLATSKAEINNGERESLEANTTLEVDALLVDIINGMEKLMGSQTSSDVEERKTSLMV